MVVCVCCDRQNRQKQGIEMTTHEK
jgi:hypothetical protein